MNITAFINTVFRESGILRKFMMVMKITSFILLIALMQVSAAGLAQKISLNEKNMPLKNVIEKIRKQSGYNFLYIKEVLDGAKPISINVKNTDFKEVLNKIFANQPFDYVVQGNDVIIRKKDPSFLDKISNILNIQEPIKGKILDENRQPVMGATITEKGTNNRTSTDLNGEFVLNNTGKDPIILISFIGYVPIEYKVKDKKSSILMVLTQITTKLDEVNVLSTGYQDIPKERATGSFEKIDNRLFNRNTSTDVISRLEGLTSSVLFDKRTSRIAKKDGLSIRGLSTLYSNTIPLIVVDNFPYDGDINNINPNDVENITILKDAAAASIWGVRAGNGVIVLTTKKGALEQALRISVGSNLTIEDNPDLMKVPTISSSDYIEVEKLLYSKGFYDGNINNVRSFPLISPVVELLIQNTDAAREKIEELKKYDVRNDFMKYVYRKPVRQQYNFNISKGNKSFSYFISGGYDNNLGNIIENKQDRLSLRSNTIFIPVKNLEIQTNILYTISNQRRQGRNSSLAYGSIRSSSTNELYPYTRLVDDVGTPLAIPKDYRNSFIEANSGIKVLDWTYNPLNEVKDNYTNSKAQDLLMNLSTNYKINSIFSADLKYQYEKTTSSSNNFQGLGSYYTRNLINRYTQLDGENVIHNIPIGAILSKSDGDFDSYNIRGQINANKTWNEKYQLSAIAGVELKQNKSIGNSYLTYGYDPDLLTYQNVDFVNSYPIYKNLARNRAIPNDASFSETLNRFTSIYANAAYTYDNRFIASLSARKDASNLFGVKANQKGVPLWSAGLSWNINNEKFYDIQWLPYLKLRSTYGYNGNLRTDLSAYTIIRNMPAFYITNAPYADVISPPNPSLKWERISIANFGIDFGLKNNIITGSIEYYKKSAKDLLAFTPIESTTGEFFVTKNSANLRAEGVDVTINGNNKLGPINWNSTLTYSYNQNKVVKYLQKYNTASGYIVSGTYSAINPIEGKPAYAIFAYKWAGLDPKTGDPQGYLNGIISKDYAAMGNVTIDEAQYFGSAIPTSFGAFRNTFELKGIALSANITYKFGYFFRRPALDYGLLFENGLGTADFNKRWQKQGDELITNVPSLVYPNDFNRDNFYAKSAALIEKGDHIRLQDISLTYSFIRPQFALKNLKLFFNINNVGIMWCSNKKGIDPDYDSSSYPASKTYSFGFNANF